MALKTDNGYILERGDLIAVRPVREGADWEPASVAIASPNGRSVVAITAANNQFLPLDVDYNSGAVTDIVTGREYEIVICDATATETTK